MLIFALTGPILLASIGGGIWLETRMFGYPVQEGQRVDPFAEMLEPSGEIPQPAHQRRLSQRSNIPVRNLAERIVEKASRGSRREKLPADEPG